MSQGAQEVSHAELNGELCIQVRVVCQSLTHEDTNKDQSSQKIFTIVLACSAKGLREIEMDGSIHLTLNPGLYHYPIWTGNGTVCGLISLQSKSTLQPQLNEYTEQPINEYNDSLQNYQQQYSYDKNSLFKTANEI